jgi:hypothetical protein
MNHPTVNDIAKGKRFWHIPTKQWVTLCNCASVSEYRKISWARNNLSQYSLAEVKNEVAV